MAATVTALAVLSGCAGPTSAPPAAVVPEAAASAGSAGGGAVDPEQVDARARRVDAALDRAVADCVADRGFPQLRAATTTPTERAALRRPVLGVHPAELGPATDAQARAYGMGGTFLLFADAPPPLVDSSAADHHAALSRCVRTVPGAEQTYARLAGWRALTNDLRTDLLARVEDPVRDLLTDRLRCTADRGYPALDVAAFLSGDTETALAQLGVRGGVLSAAPPDPPPLPPGTTRVLTPPPRQTYVPSEPEVAFALTYVACGRASGFTARLQALTGPVAGQLAASRRAELDRYDAAFVAELDLLAAR